MRFLFSSLLLCTLGLLAGCDTQNPDDVIEAVVRATVTDVAAGAPIGSGHYTFFSLRDRAVVPAADSLTDRWDVAFRDTTILVNGGPGRAGRGAAQIVEGGFDALDRAPTSGYAQDTDAALAIPTGSGNGWYRYTSALPVLTPIPGRVLIVRTADGRYAKLRILSYYRGAPASPTIFDVPGYYTFEYVFQPDGSRSFDSN